MERAPLGECNVDLLELLDRSNVFKYFGLRRTNSNCPQTDRSAEASSSNARTPRRVATTSIETGCTQEGNLLESQSLATGVGG